MSKKSLNRTVIEGGRTGDYKSARDQTNRTERHQFKQYLNQVSKDIDLYDYGDDPVSMEPIDKNYSYDEKFADKLGPAKRFLKSKVGKSWDKTYSQLRETFDDRTTSGRHILFDHLLLDISKANDDHRWYSDLVVDKNGVLRERKKIPRRYWYSGYPSSEEWENAIKFLKGRKVGQLINGDLYWFEPVQFGIFCVVSDYRTVVFQVPYNMGKIIYAHKNGWGASCAYSGGFRQAKKLTDRERGQFMTLNRKVREEILSHSPIFGKEGKAA